MTKRSLLFFTFLLIGNALLTACGGGGGDRAAGVEPGPDAPGGAVTPPTPIVPGDSIAADDLAPADTVSAEITGVTMQSPPTITFNLTVNGRHSVSDLQASHLAFSLARLVSTADDHHNWQSYISRQEDPICRSQEDIDSPYTACTSFTAASDPAAIPDTARKVQHSGATGKTVTSQASTENSGTLQQNSDASWSYTYQSDPGDPAALTQMHRACIQFRLNTTLDDLCVDFIPSDLVNPAIGLAASSLDQRFYSSYPSRQIVTEATCNSCHDKLALHGGGRTSTDYCVSCHNPGVVDANSGNSVDFKVLIHRLHNARNLQSVIDGTPYIIWGYRNYPHDYSNTSYPQRITNCTRCHAGEEDVAFAAANDLPPPTAVITPDGHNWASNPNAQACLSCHEIDMGTEHSPANPASCDGCHGDGGFVSVQQVHFDQAEALGRRHSLQITSVSQTGPGESPLVTFNVQLDGEKIDLATFTGQLKLGFAWDAASDYQHLFLKGEVDALTQATHLGGFEYQLDMASTSPSLTVDNDIDTVAVMLFGHTLLDGEIAAIDSVVEYHASTASTATPRRDVVDIDNCNSCHHRYYQKQGTHTTHGAMTDVKVCVGCHNPTLGFSAYADFRVLIHGLHAVGFRENAFRSWDDENLQFPGELSACETCHLADTHQLPLDTTPVIRNASAFTTTTAATCGACHDSAVAAAHMQSAGGAVINADEQTAIDAVESCDFCHGDGGIADVDQVHNR